MTEGLMNDRLDGLERERPMGFFDSPQEWLPILIVIVVLLFGAKKLPELARSVGRARGEFTRGQREIERELRAEETTYRAAPPSPAEESPTVKAAKALGIDVTGKTEEQLKREIEARLKAA